MTTQPKDLMTLEEILAEIKDRLKTAQRCLEANVRSQSEGKETLELAVRLNREDVRLLTSALHHLGAGRKAMDRLDSIHQMAAYPADCASNLIGDPDAESKLRLRIADLSFLNPCALTAHEAKETICPGCGKPSNHMEPGTTSDHWGVWHGECEKQFWMAGTGLDDRVPPFSKRNVEVKEEPC